jgi:hypothetical protein
MAGIDYSITAGSNTSIAGIAVSDSTVPSNLDNIVRQLMADIRRAWNDLGAKATSGGAADVQTLTTETVYTAYADGTVLGFIAGFTNTGATTLNVDGVGAKAVVKAAGTALAAGDITAGAAYIVVYDASQGAGSWMLLNPAGITAAAVAAGYQPLDAALTALTTAFVVASGSAPSSLAFFEDTDTGVNKITVTAPSSVASSNKTITLPDSTGTAALTSDFIGQETIWVPARAMRPRTTAGSASLAVLETTTNDVMLEYLAFDSTTKEGAQFGIQMPKGWDEGDLIAQFIWTHPAAATFGVSWELAAVAFANDDAADTAFGTLQEIDDTGGTTHDVYITDETPAITVAGTPAAEEYVMFQVTRDPADAGDTLNVDAWLLGVKIHYTINAAKDD